MEPRPTLAASAGVLALGSLFTQAAQILSISVLARLVSKPELATYQQLNLFTNLLSPLLLAGVPTGLLFFMSRAGGREEQRAWVSRAYALLGAMGLSAALAAVLLRHPIGDLFNNPRLPAALPLFAPYLIFAFIAAATPPALVAAGTPGLAALLNAALGGFMLVALVTAALIDPSGQSLALGLSASGAALAAASIAAVCRAVGRPRLDPGLRSGLRSLLAYGLPLTVAGLAGTLGFQFDRVVVGASFRPQDFAIYALGAVEIPLGLLLGQAVTTVLVPELAERWREGDRHGMLALWQRAMHKTGLVLLPLFVLLAVMAEEIIRVLYGPAYDRSVGIFRIYLLLIPLRIANWGIIPTAIGRTRMHAGASVILLASNAAVALAAVGPLGLSGPALAAPVATVLAALYYLVRVRHILDAPLSALVPVRALVAIMVVALVAAAPLLLIRDVVTSPLVRLLLGTCTYLVVVGAGLRLTRQIPDTDWTRLTSAVARGRGS
jgi:O-antigen/teichoic acid export membrane protein